MKGFQNPPGILCALWEAQDGKCFHCDEPMFFMKSPASVDKKLATREHLYPVSKGGSRFRNNVVLAHALCNSQRGAPDEPTPKEKAKAMVIYSLLGLTAFKQPPFTSEEEAQQAKVCTAARIRMMGVPRVMGARSYQLISAFTPPTLGDVFLSILSAKAHE